MIIIGLEAEKFNYPSEYIFYSFFHLFPQIIYASETLELAVMDRFTSIGDFTQRGI